MLSRLCALTVVVSFLLPAVSVGQKKVQNGGDDVASLEAKIRRFAPTVITADASRLSPGDRRALGKIIGAAKLFDPLYLRLVL